MIPSRAFPPLSSLGHQSSAAVAVLYHAPASKVIPMLRLARGGLIFTSRVQAPAAATTLPLSPPETRSSLSSRGHS